MNVFVLACLLALTALSSAQNYKRAEEFDFRSFLANEQSSEYIYRASMDCFLDRRPCDDKELKETLMGILMSRCEHCTPSMLEKYKWVMNTLKSEHPEDYNAVINKVHEQVTRVTKIQ